MEFVAVDIETTGFSQKYDSIISIGAVHVKDYEVVGEFSELIHTTKVLKQEIIKLTGITNVMLKDAPTYPIVLTEFLEFLGDKPFVAHNATFDYRFLNTKCENKLGHTIRNKQICTMREAKKKYPDLANHRLDTLCKHLGIPNAKHHDALNDARVCADILLCIIGAEAVATRPNSTLVSKLKMMANKFWE